MINPFISSSRVRDLLLTKGFWGGIAMSAPFYAEFFSWFWAATLILPLLFLVAFRRGKLSLPHAAILPMLGLLLLHVIALGYSETRFEFQVIKDLITASFILSVYLLADEDTSEGFFYAVIPLGIVTAVLGLIKAGMLDKGYLVGFILDNCYYYPAGSALCVNYNNLGLLWLVAALGCLKNRWWLLLPILVAAGMLSSSRRFIVLAGILPFVWVVLQGIPAVTKSMIVAVMVLLTIYCVTDPASFERYRFGQEPYKVVFNFYNKDAHIDENVSTDVSTGADSVEGMVGGSVQINRSVPSAMLSTMTDGTLGTASRSAYWKLAFSNIGWIPQGWIYHEGFSCFFSSCTEFHYPHMSIMSEWIIGGVFFGMVAIMFYAFPGWVVLRRKSTVHIALLMFAVPYSLISGDTVFSLPVYISCMLVALSSVPRKTQFSL